MFEVTDKEKAIGLLKEAQLLVPKNQRYDLYRRWLKQFEEELRSGKVQLITSGEQNGTLSAS